MNPSKCAVTAPVVQWIADRGYRLEPGRSFACWWEEKLITYRPQEAAQTMLRGLLHECGHILVSESINRETTGTRFKNGYPSERTGMARTNSSAADLLNEEIEAWHRGFELGQRLEIKIDEPAYWKDYGVCIKRYCKRILQRKV